MTRGAATRLAWGLGLCVLGANVAIKPAPTLTDVRRASDGVRRSREWRGRSVPAFDLPLLDGQVFRANPPAGHPMTVLVFFTTWCEVCAPELSEIQQFVERLHADGQPLRVVGIDVQEEAQVVRRFAKQHALTLPMGVDGSGDVMRAYDVRTFPTTVVVGEDGRARLFHEGPVANADVVLDPVVGGQRRTHTGSRP